jgi:hypothetical protein
MQAKSREDQAFHKVGLVGAAWVCQPRAPSKFDTRGHAMCARGDLQIIRLVGRQAGYARVRRWPWGVELRICILANGEHVAGAFVVASKAFGFAAESSSIRRTHGSALQIELRLC